MTHSVPTRRSSYLSTDETGGLEPGASDCDFFIVEFDEGAADVPVVDDAEQLECCLGGGCSIVGDAHDGVDRGEHPREDVEGLGVVAGVERFGHRLDLVAGHVPDDRDHTGRAVCQPTQVGDVVAGIDGRSEEHTSELQSLMRNSYAVFCLTKK